jgi:hypothetical protein
MPLPSKVRYLPRRPSDAVREAGHVVMTAYWALRLMLNRSDTRPTYMYCWHMDRLTYFRSRFKAWLEAEPAHERFWTQRRLFVDDMPDPAAFKSYPEGTVGRAFYEMCRVHDTKGLLDLRSRRLECLPDEAKALDLESLRGIEDPDVLYERIVARRNIFMTSTHDLCHMLTGSNTEVDGEAVVAKYQYHHLLVPQNWLNMMNAMLVHLVTGRWSRMREIMASFSAIRASRNYAELDYAELWGEPLEAVRRGLGLPEEGLMPDRTA